MELSDNAKKVLNDPSRIKRRDQWFIHLQDLLDGEREGDVVIKGVRGRAKDDALLFANPEQWVIESLENLAAQIDRCDNDNAFVPPCVEPGLYGVHFVDSLFGANVYYDTGAQQWYNDYLTTDVGTLVYPNLEACEIWSIAQRSAKAFVAQEVALPLFGLPTVASVLNIAVNLYGQNILAAMLVEPEDAAHDLSIINDVLMALHRWYRSVIPAQQLQPVVSWQRTQPPEYGQICGCTTQLISASVYDEMIAMHDNALLGVYPNGGLLHLCGSHSHLIPSFAAMPNLRAIQINDRAAHDLELYFHGLREDQIIYIGECEGMPLKRVMEITGGRRLVVIA